MFLQETHLHNLDHKKLGGPLIGQVFCSKFNSKVRGTATLIRKNVHFISNNTIADPGSHFVIVTGTEACNFSIHLCTELGWSYFHAISVVLKSKPKLSYFDTRRGHELVLDRSSCHPITDTH